MLGCKPSSFPMEPNQMFEKDNGDTRVDATKYRRLIGRLLYLQATRPDLAYSVNILSQFVSDPRQGHWDAAMRIPLISEGHTGSRRSRTGYLLLLGGALVSWKSKKQFVVSRSSAEAEYRVMATTTSEIL
ncbi:uncharacterized mitochondrial protein-like protein [Tanacetum coccineum]